MNLRNKIHFATIGTAIIFTSCGKDPIADFSWSPAQPKVGEQITFINLSQDAKSYSWNFGDTSIGMDEEPNHVYKAKGTYTVDLAAIKGLKSSEKSATIIVSE